MRTYLDVPFSQREEVRRLGARWDASRKLWFVENVENIEPFMRWMTGRQITGKVSTEEVPPWERR